MRTVLGLAFLAGACIPAEPADEIVARDSAGVRIVTSARAAWGDRPAWRVVEPPVLTIGVEQGDEPYQFYRIGGALRLGNGEIVVGNSGSGEIRFFDSTGRFLRSAGRRGGGPGEFHQFSRMQVWRWADRLAVNDRANARVNLWDTTGGFDRSVRLQGTAEVPRPLLVSPLPPAGWLAMAFEGGGALGGSPGTIIRSRLFYLRLDDSGRVGNRLLSVESRPRYVHEYRGIPRFPYVPLTAEPLVATRRDLYVVRGNAAVLETWDTTGRLIALARWTMPPRPITADLYRRYRDADLEDTPDAERRRQYAHYYEQDLPLPETVPEYEGIVVDAAGSVWLRRYRLPWEPDPQWDVVDSTGRWLGTVGTPRGAGVLEIGRDFLLARHLDSLSVERIHLYRLLRRIARPP